MNDLKRTLFVAVLGCCLLLMAGCSASIDPATAEKDVRLKTDELIHAWKVFDEEWLDQNLADGYVITAQDLNVVTKEQVLEYALTAEEEPGTVEITEWRTIVKGNTVVALYKTTWQYDDGGSNEARATDVWTYRDGKWIVLAEHVSQISLTGSADSDAG